MTELDLGPRCQALFPDAGRPETEPGTFLISTLCDLINGIH